MKVKAIDHVVVNVRDVEASASPRVPANRAFSGPSIFLLTDE